MTVPFRVMILDDERLSRITTAKQLEKRGYISAAIANPFAALKKLEEERWDVVLTDLRMPGMDGIEFMKKAKERDDNLAVIVMTAYGTVETAVDAMKAGAVDYLLKPFKLEELDLRLSRIRESASTKRELHSLQELLANQSAQFGLIGQSPPMQEVANLIRTFADHDAPILITGETGTGKEVVSRALHDSSSRKDKPFVPVACGTIPSELAESELFGHERGSFTGAVGKRIGIFERATGGTVLLDDIDDLPLNIQVKLLRVLQEGTLVRVGGSHEIAVDVRTIATSKVNLANAVSKRQFRDDLFYRLRGLEIMLPRLADRGDDVLLLAAHYFRIVAHREGRVWDSEPLSIELAEALRSYPWPGNVRELRRAVESIYILSKGSEIRREHLPAFLRSGAELNSEPKEPFTLSLEGLPQVDLPGLMERFEDRILSWAMKESAGQQKKAAELLGIPRTTLQSRLNRSRPGLQA